MIIRNVSDEDRWLPDVGVNVPAGGTFEATGDLAESYLKQPDVFRRVDTPARKRAAAARRKPAKRTQPEKSAGQDPSAAVAADLKE